MIGVGYRREMASWIRARPRGVSCLELTAEHFYRGDHEATFAALRRDYRLYVHGLALSLGTPGPLDARHLDQFTRVVRAVDPDWISDHIAFTRTRESDLGHLNPVPPTREMVRLLADHAREVADRCRKPLLLENITSYLKLEGDLTETEFLNELCARADCGLLLDVTNLFINSRNHRFDPLAWLRELDPARIRQLHLVGYAREGERYIDSHAEPIQPDLLELAAEVVRYAPVQSIVLERDEAIPDAAALDAEVAKLTALLARN